MVTGISYVGGAAAESSQAGPLPVSPARGLGTTIPGLLAPTSITQGQQVGRAWTTRGRGWKGAPTERECSRREDGREQSPQPVFVHGRLGGKRQAGDGGPGWAPLMFWPQCPGSSGSQEGPHAWMFFVPGSLASDPSANLRSRAGEAWSGGQKVALCSSHSCLAQKPGGQHQGGVVGQTACAPTGGPLLEVRCLSQPCS